MLRGWIAIVVCAACSSDERDVRVFDACEPLSINAPSASDAQLASIDRAIAAWSAIGVLAPVRAAADARVEVTFESAGAAFYGYYDGDASAIYINSDLTIESQRAITIEHELGHALGLVHVPAAQRGSVMNPGNLTIEPTAADASAIAARWGECPTP